MAGFAFARYKFPGRNVLFIALLATIMMHGCGDFRIHRRLFGTRREAYWGQVMAARFMSSLPLIINFLIFRRTFISGITTGAFK